MDQQVVFGIRAVMEAVKAGKEVEKCFIRKGLQGELYREFFSLVKERDIPFQFVPDERLNRITRKNHQGVVAYLSAIEYQQIEQLLPLLFEAGKAPFILLLDEVTDVRNFGAIARTAACGGVDALVIPLRGSAMITADAIKTSVGALFSLPVCRVNTLSRTVDYLRNSGLQMIGATEKATRVYHEPDYTLPTGIVMGSEEKGLHPEIIRRMDQLVKIPLLGQIGSLNVSVAAGIFIYETVRQRSSQ